MWEVEPKEWEYEPVLTHEEGTNNVTINFVQVWFSRLQLTRL